MNKIGFYSREFELSLYTYYYNGYEIDIILSDVMILTVPIVPKGFTIHPRKISTGCGTVGIICFIVFICIVNTARLTDEHT